jgi:hypothetical protein
VTIASSLDKNHKGKICNICNLAHIVDFHKAVKDLMDKEVGSTLTLKDLEPLNLYVNQILEGHYKHGMKIDKSSFNIY